MDNENEWLERFDDDEYIETDADLKKREIINYLEGNATIPFELFDQMSWEIKTKSALYEGTNKRIMGSIYIDAIMLYGFLQYTRKWHEREGRLENNTFQCTRVYTCNALHWSYNRYNKAMKILKMKDLVRIRLFPITDKKTNQLMGSYVRIDLPENN